MATFKDNQGKPWEVKLTVPTISKVKELHGIELANLEKDPMQKLRNDPLTLIAIIFLLCQKTIEERGLTAEQFGECLPSPPDELVSAMEDAIVNFFPSGQHSHVREHLADLAELNDAGIKVVAAKRKKYIGDPKSIEMIGIAVEKEMEANRAKAFGTITEHGTSPT